ncbi:MAG TPA: hypothetical protein PLP19_20300 [bacterium]|nr:hypothetical protein [bacterium]HPN45838.1 hypothetical protein [bacterium]
MIINKSMTRPVATGAGLLLILLLALLLFTGCSREDKVQELQPQTNVEATAEITTPEQSMAILLPLQEKILQTPDNVDLRRELVAASVNSEQKTLRAVGYGLPPEHAANSAMAQQAAERAAYLDACRWAAYIIKWQDSPDSPAFGEIEGNIPGARIIYKETADDGKISMVVELAMENN